MKRLLSLVIALLLALSAVSFALAEEKTLKTPYYTITLPDGWDYDTSEAEAFDEDSEFLGSFTNKQDVILTVESYLIRYAEMADISLAEFSAEDLQDYADVMLEDFSDSQPVALGIVTAGSIPFVLIKAADEQGEYVYADTLLKGLNFQFVAYAQDAAESVQPITDEQVEAIKTILATFMPEA